jgi:anti-anti-sigma factor
MERNFRLEVHSKEDTAVVTVRGELDLASSPALVDELERATSSGAALVIADLTQLEFMDSTGLSVLVRAHHRARETGQRFAVVNGSPQVQRLLSLTGVAERLTLVDDLGQLLDEGSHPDRG